MRKSLSETFKVLKEKSMPCVVGGLLVFGFLASLNSVPFGGSAGHLVLSHRVDPTRHESQFLFCSDTSDRFHCLQLTFGGPNQGIDGGSVPINGN